MSTGCSAFASSGSKVEMSRAGSASISYKPSSNDNETSCNGHESVMPRDDIGESNSNERLFSSDRFPRDGKINSYSKMQYLIDIVEILGGTKEFDILLNSQFMKLFTLPTSRCSLSGLLVHNLLCRQLISHNKHDAWFTFGGYPLRFSISEFEQLTGLMCGPLPDGSALSDVEYVPRKGKSYWRTLFGNDNCVVIADLVDKLKRDSSIPNWKRLRLVLIVIVEGILICGTQPVCASRRIVEMVSDLSSFLTYPWGRESFTLTLRRMKVGSHIKTTASLGSKLKQTSVAMHGFPLALQLLMFESIPSLLTYLPRSDSPDTFLDRSFSELPRLKTFHTGNILTLELDPKLIVISRLANRAPRYSVDVPSDKRVSFLEYLLDEGRRFTQNSWLGGDTSLSPLCVCSTTKDGRCTCAKMSKVQRSPSTTAVASHTSTERHCNECEELKNAVLRLEAGQISMTEQLTEIIQSEFIKIRAAILADVQHMLAQKTVNVVTKSTNQAPPTECAEHTDRNAISNPNSVQSDEAGVGGGLQTLSGGVTGIPEVKNPKLIVTRTDTQPDADFLQGTSGYIVKDNPITDSAPVTIADIANINKTTSPDLSPSRICTPSAVNPSDTAPNVHLGDCISTKEMKTPTSTSNKQLVPRKRSGRVLLSPAPTTESLETSQPCSSKRVRLSPPSDKITPFYSPFPENPPALVSRFKSRLRRYKQRGYELGGVDVPKNFFFQLMSPQEWLANTHIDLLIRSVWNRCGSRLITRGLTITDCYFTQFLTSYYNEFLATKGSTCNWPNMLRSYVSGVVPDRDGVTPWGNAIHLIYAPMNWGCKHWVGLFIDLQDWEIHILDPLHTATPKWKIGKLMAPVAAMLPHLLDACCGPDAREYLRLMPFKCTRPTGLAENLRTGDCGPLVVKFIELHSHGLSLAGITDKMVDELRISYAIQVYSDFVSPVS